MTDLIDDYHRSGFGIRLGAGVRPAVLVIDICAAYLTEGSPLRAPVEDAVAAAAHVVDLARTTRHPVLFTRIVHQRGGSDGGLFRAKVPALQVIEEGSPLGAFLADPAPLPGDIVITKQYASAFHGTSLATTLTTLGIDTLLIVGLTTSGCVRATATDAMQHGFRPLVIAEACGDRDPRLQQANLLDLEAKYADVITMAEASSTLRRLSGPA